MLQDGQGVQGAQGAQLDTQGAHAPNVGGGVEVTELYNRAILEALLALARAIMTQANLSMVPRVNAMESTMSSRLRDFVRFNSSIIFG